MNPPARRALLAVLVLSVAASADAAAPPRVAKPAEKPAPASLPPTDALARVISET